MVDRYSVFIERQNEGDSPDPRLVLAIGQGPANSIETICVGDPFAHEIFQAVPENIARERIRVTNGKQSDYFKPAEWLAQRFIDQCFQQIPSVIVLVGPKRADSLQEIVPLTVVEVGSVFQKTVYH